MKWYDHLPFLSILAKKYNNLDTAITYFFEQINVSQFHYN